MNIQLYLNDIEIDLNDNISIPLNRTFENLSNPTNVIVDYSKSINIPITSHNTQVFGQIFRLDRVIIDGDEIVGTGFNPSQKISMRLMYNGDILIEGYAKFLSTTYTSTTKHYTISLFGVLGDVFQKLTQVVLTQDELPENLTSEYILDDHLDGSYINKELVKESWDNDNPIIKLSNSTNTDIVGFAPTYRGYYNNFKSDTVQTGTSTTQSIEEYIIDKYKKTYKIQYPNSTDEEAQSYVDSLDISSLVGDGFKDYEMNQYRSYQLKPYIYFNKLVQMYQEILPKISDYKLELDQDWFNTNNPYWSRLCYMLDYLEEKGSANVLNTPTDLFDSVYRFDVNETIRDTIVLSNVINGSIQISPFQVQIQQIAQAPYYEDKRRELIFNNTSAIWVQYKVGTVEKSIWFVNDINNSPVDTTQYDVRTLNQYSTTQFKTSVSYIKGSKDYIANIMTIKLPQVLLEGNIQNGDELSVVIKVYDLAPSQSFAQPYTLIYYNGRKEVQVPFELLNDYQGSNPPATFEIQPNIYIQTIQRQNVPLKLSNIYKRGEPLFNVILQYTKMFGLLWDVDYINRKIKIVTRDNYFKNYTIEDWSDKIDISNEFVINPVAFDTQVVKFNYDEVDGYRFKSYQDRYNSVYGDKKLYTEYKFNTETSDLFDDIQPSCVGSRSYPYFDNIYNWNLSGVINQKTDNLVRIEDSNEDDSGSSNVSGWYFRGTNITNQSYITDDSDYQLQNDSCYYGFETINNSIYSISTTNFPQFSVVNGDYGCIFNKPMEDYTYNSQIAGCNNYIYNNQWENYINERYNIQNKKVTTYFNLNPNDYLNFKFNKFIRLQNQLFMVNKIFDYQLNSTSHLTKCELVQISDINPYINGSLKFNPLIVNKSFIYIDMDREQIMSANGNFNIIVYTSEKPTVTIDTPNVGSLGILTSKEIYNEFRYTFLYQNMGYINDTMFTNITFSNKYGSVTIPVTIVGAGRAEITPRLQSVFYDIPDGGISFYFDSTPRPTQMSLIQTGGNMWYGYIELVDVRNDSDTSVDGELEWTHIMDEIYIGELRARNSFTSKRVPVIIDTQSTVIYCSDQWVEIENEPQGIYMLDFWSSEDDYTVELVEDSPHPQGTVQLITNEQYQGDRYIELYWENFNSRGTWEGRLIVSNSLSTRIIPIIIKINN